MAEPDDREREARTEGQRIVDAYETDVIAQPFELAAAIDKALDAERARADAVMFSPIGDNHHNAAACPYCNPAFVSGRQRAEAAEARAETLKAALREIGRIAGRTASSDWNFVNIGNLVDAALAAAPVAPETLAAALREPTVEMRQAALDANRALPDPRPLRVGFELHDSAVIWKAMLAAAPVAPETLAAALRKISSLAVMSEGNVAGGVVSKREIDAIVAAAVAAAPVAPPEGAGQNVLKPGAIMLTPQGPQFPPATEDDHG